MKKRFFVGLVATFLLLLASCSTAPVMADVNFPADGSKYVVLGRVTLEVPSSKSGYVKLLEAAKAQYPNCDDVVNIVVDAKSYDGLLIKSYKYIMSGVAIDYVEVK
ncbi:MAG: hypothetical protein P1P64_04355 [Treponemataceae bacterium]